MLPPQRHAVILALIREHGGVRVSDLARELGVSDMTVRRDLEVLAERGSVVKIHGGATAVGGHPTTDEPGFVVKQARERAEKRAIATVAAAEVAPGTSVVLSAGTTTFAVAQQLTAVPGLTVVTNSLRIAELFHDGDGGDQTVVLTGGIRTPSDALVGPFALAALRDLHVDLAFMGVHGMAPRSGFTCPNLMEAETDRALIASARQLVVVADHTKWGVVGLCSIARLRDADLLITDDGLEPTARTVLEQEVGRLILARTGKSDEETA